MGWKKKVWFFSRLESEKQELFDQFAFLGFWSVRLRNYKKN